ncbi:MAG TPA: S26 family signal peptidase [Candidatus Saccharimonadales bacterium]|nr:S26 family signal peptidase [Candidatus Saccharimonadales bacterium]
MLYLRRVTGDSMAPTLTEGRVVLLMRPYRVPRRGDVVMLRHAGLEKLKRITAVSSRLDKLYVEGDNEAQSTDSRHFGWLPRTAITGIVIWPRNRTARQKSPK